MERRKKMIQRQMFELNERKKSVNVFDGTNDVPYKRHRQEVLKIEKKVDNFSPIISAANFFARMKIKGAQRQMELQTRTNLGLVNYVNMIHRTEGKVDSFNRLAAKRNSNFQYRLAEQRQIEFLNKKFSKILQSIGPSRISCAKDLRDDWELFYRPSIISNSKYPIAIDALLSSEDSPSYEEYTRAPKVFFNFCFANHDELGTIIIMLSCSNEPEIVEKFIELCSNRNKNGCYKGCNLHKIVKDLLIESGDVHECFNMNRIELFPSSNKMGEHLNSGTVSMLLNNDGSVSSKFCITLKKLPSLNDKQIVIGRVVKGLKFLQFAAEGFGTRFGAPQKAIFIKSSGTIK